MNKIILSYQLLPCLCGKNKLCISSGAVIARLDKHGFEHNSVVTVEEHNSGMDEPPLPPYIVYKGCLF